MAEHAPPVAAASPLHAFTAPLACYEKSRRRSSEREELVFRGWKSIGLCPQGFESLAVHEISTRSAGRPHRPNRPTSWPRPKRHLPTPSTQHTGLRCAPHFASFVASLVSMVTSRCFAAGFASLRLLLRCRLLRLAPLSAPSVGWSVAGPPEILHMYYMPESLARVSRRVGWSHDLMSG